MAYRSDTDPELADFARFRSGALPRIEVCPPSWVESKGQLDASDAPAGLGKAFHDAMAQAAVDGRDAVDLERHAARHGCARRDLEYLWRRFGFDPQGGEAEVPVELIDREHRLVVRGRLDWVQEEAGNPGTFDLADWKTTRRIDEDPEPWNDPATQSYAVGFFEQRDGVRAVRTFKVYPRRGDEGWTAPLEIDAASMPAVRERVLAIAREGLRQSRLPLEQRRYAISHHCDYCPGRATCPAQRREVAALFSAIREVPIAKKDGSPGRRTATVLDLEVSYETAPALHELRKLLKKGADALGEHVKAFVAAFGPVEVERDKWLAVLPSYKRAPLNEEQLERAAAELGPDVAAAVEKILAWRERQPKVREERLDIYTEDKLLAAERAEALPGGARADSD
jgi:hypothetical protein